MTLLTSLISSVDAHLKGTRSLKGTPRTREMAAKVASSVNSAAEFERGRWWRPK